MSDDNFFEDHKASEVARRLRGIRAGCPTCAYWDKENIHLKEDFFYKMQHYSYCSALKKETTHNSHCILYEYDGSKKNDDIRER